jgi:hypothetical protein
MFPDRLLMFLWLWNYWELLSIGNQPTSNAGRSGAAIGAALGTGAILFVWLVGAVVTGLFAILTRGKRVYIQTPSVVSLPAKRLSGWRRVAAVLVIAMRSTSILFRSRAPLSILRERNGRSMVPWTE